MQKTHKFLNLWVFFLSVCAYLHKVKLLHACDLLPAQFTHTRGTSTLQNYVAFEFPSQSSYHPAYVGQLA